MLPSMNTPIQTKVVEILAAYQWTEPELAARVGCSQPHINRIKRGRATRVSYELGHAINRLYEERPQRPVESVA